MQIIRRNIVYIMFLCFVIMLVGLLFNDNVWFDETYTLALIRHSYVEMIDILKTDMHPPLYFVGLKFFVPYLAIISLLQKSFLPLVFLCFFCLAAVI